MKTLIAVLLVALFLILPVLALAGECPAPGDQSPCDGAISKTELFDYIDKWFKCSACVPDLHLVIKAYLR